MIICNNKEIAKAYNAAKHFGGYDKIPTKTKIKITFRNGFTILKK